MAVPGPGRRPLKLGELVPQVFGLPAAEWRGELHCHIFGKSGEAFFATGFLKPLRSVVPKARIVYWVHGAYEPMILGAVQQPDAIRLYHRRPEMSLMEDVNDLIYARHEWMGREAWWWDGNVINLSMYYANLSDANDDPFYRQNMRSLGIGDLPFDPPRISAYGIQNPDGIALVIPTGNPQSVIQRLPVPPAEWARLAKLCRARGLKPIARSYLDDPPVQMPGWSLDLSTNPFETLHLGLTAERVVGLNTGMLYALTQVAPGRVTMLNPHPYRYYDFEPMIADGVIDPTRHRQVPIGQTLTPAEATALVEEALVA